MAKRKQEKNFFIQLELPSGQRHCIEATSELTADVLKWKVHGITNVSPKLQHLYFEVTGKYGADDSGWLGLKGTTDPESTGWPVAYHGTPEMNVMSILREGFDLSKGKGFAYGKGIYCSPNPAVAMGYAQHYHWNGKTYYLIIQCRVDPTVLKEFGQIWLVPDGNYIRPYAICAYEQPGQ